MSIKGNPFDSYFTDQAAAHDLAGEDLARLQQTALSAKLADLLPKLPPLAALARAQGLDEEVLLCDAPKLFFPHTIYKTYDPAWLLAGNFARMNRWLQQFTTVDLKNGELPQFSSIDGWLAWLENTCGIDVAHSSGTTGRMSLIARAKEDAEARHARNRVAFVTLVGEHGVAPDDAWFHIVWPGAAGGRSAQQKMAEGSRRMSARSPDHFLSLYHNDLGADYEFFVVRARLARRMGRLDLPSPSPYVEARLAEADRRHAQYAQDQERLIHSLAELAGKRIMLMGSPHSLATICRAGVEHGLGRGFAAQSAHVSVGGLKGLDAPADYATVLDRFLGPSIPIEGYGATEMNTGYMKCRHGRFHVPPWVAIYVLDPAGGWQPKPREGKQEGRGAFLDLAFASAWGGLVTADHIEIDYTPCGCGRKSPSILSNIRRVADSDEDFSWIPASGEAVNAALEELLRAS